MVIFTQVSLTSDGDVLREENMRESGRGGKRERERQRMWISKGKCAS